jgi:hypothetical protein
MIILWVNVFGNKDRRILGIQGFQQVDGRLDLSHGIFIMLAG